MKKINLFFAMLAAVSISALGIGTADADIVLYEGGTPNGDQGFFSFGDFTVTDTTDGVVIDNSEGDASDDAGLFGGFGNNSFDVQDFDPATNELTVEFRFLEGDASGFFNFVLSDIDDENSAQDNQFTFTSDAASDVGDGSGFLTQSILLSEEANFQQTSFGFDDSGDGIFNPGLREVQVQSAFGSTDALIVEIRSIRISAIPEPGSLALLGLVVPAFALRRRR